MHWFTIGTSNGSSPIQCQVITTHLLSIEHADWQKLHDMFNARDANVWQSEFPVGFPVEVSALNSIFINIFHDVVACIESRCVIKQNMSCWSVDSFDFALEKLHSRWSARAFFPRKIERINRPTRHVFFHITHQWWSILEVTIRNTIQRNFKQNRKAIVYQISSKFVLYTWGPSQYKDIVSPI